jgi:hypothetical protein
MKIHPDVLAAHAQFGGDLETMQKAYEYTGLKYKISELEDLISEYRDHSQPYWEDRAKSAEAKLKDGISFLHKLVENAFSWGKQDCNYLNPKHIDAFIEATRNGMSPEGAAAWVATGKSPQTCDHPFLYETVDECAAAGKSCFCGKRRTQGLTTENVR